MRLIQSLFLFYLVSFVGIYVVFIFFDPKNNFSIWLEQSINGQNGITGIVGITTLITAVGVIIFLTHYFCGNPILKAVKEHSDEGIISVIKHSFFKK